jgi:precorrin-2 dehydrogenase/sirohydrochlorin ferrochelatase
VSGYPVTLVGLEQTRCVVIGGGEVASRKAAALCAAGARPVVISPELCEALERLEEQHQVEAVRRPYRCGDLAGAHLVIAATDDAVTNEVVWQEAQALGCLVNVADDPLRCNFHVPATVRRGPLTLSVSTGGNSPLLARRIREMLEEQFDPAYESYVALLGELRPVVQDQVHDPVQRKALWQALLESEILTLLRSGQTEAAREAANGILERFGS